MPDYLGYIKEDPTDTEPQSVSIEKGGGTDTKADANSLRISGLESKISGLQAQVNLLLGNF